jgi:zinc protease
MMRSTFLGLCFAVFAGPAFAAAQINEISPNVWLVEDHTLPIVTVKITFENSGAAYDPEDRQGLASFMSVMLDEGAGDMDSLAFHKELESTAIRFGVDAQEDAFSVSVQSLSEYKDRALELFDMAIFKPRFDPDAIERMRTGIVSELKEMEESPEYTASLNWKRAAFPHHPYGNPKRGTFASVAAITREDLQGFAKSHFSCSPRLISVVGDITPQEVKKWLSGPDFGPATCPPAVPVIKDITVTEGGASPVVVPMPVPQTVVTASLPGVLRSDPRYYAAVVLNHILGGDTLTSRLGKEIRDKRGLAYYAQSDLAALDHAGYIVMQFATRSEQTPAALDIFRKELAKISSQGVTAEELTDAKNYITGSYPLQLDNQSALADYLLSIEHYRLGLDYMEKRNGLIQAVTLEQVNALAKDLLSHTPLVVMVGTPEKREKQ